MVRVSMIFLVVTALLAMSGCGSLSRWTGSSDPAQIVCSQSNVAGLLSVFNGGSNITSVTIYHPEKLKGIKVTGEAAGCPGFEFDGTQAVDSESDDAG